MLKQKINKKIKKDWERKHTINLYIPEIYPVYEQKTPITSFTIIEKGGKNV